MSKVMAHGLSYRFIFMVKMVILILKYKQLSKAYWDFIKEILMIQAHMNKHPT